MKLMNKMKKGMAVVSVIALSNITFAAGVAELAEGWGNTASAVQILLLIGAALVGLGMMAAGAMQLKQHGENPQKVPLSKGLIFLASGAVLFGLSATSTTMIDTVFGGEADGNVVEIDTEF